METIDLALIALGLIGLFLEAFLGFIRGTFGGGPYRDRFYKEDTRLEGRTKICFWIIAMVIPSLTGWFLAIKLDGELGFYAGVGAGIAYLILTFVVFVITDVFSEKYLFKYFN